MHFLIMLIAFIHPIHHPLIPLMLVVQQERVAIYHEDSMVPHFYTINLFLHILRYLPKNQVNYLYQSIIKFN